MEDIAAPAAPLRRGSRLGEDVAIIVVRRPVYELPAAVVDVAEDVDRADLRHGCRHTGGGPVEIVAPDAHVAVRALGLDGVVPGVHDDVAVDVGVAVREADVGEVLLAADRVHEVAALVAVDLVEAEDVVAAALAEEDRVRAGGVALRPAVGAVARVVDLVVLDDHALQARALAAIGGDARVHVHADLPAGIVHSPKASPLADVVLFDHHVVRVRLDADRVLLRAFHRKAAHDHVRCGDADREGLRIAHIDRAALVQQVALRRAALADLERRRAGADLDRLRDRKPLAPGARCELDARRLSRQAQAHEVLRAGRQVDDAAAAFAVARVVPERQRLFPRLLAALPIAHEAAGRPGSRWRLPVNAERLESGDRLAAGRQRGFAFADRFLARCRSFAGQRGACGKEKRQPGREAKRLHH